RGGAGGRRRRGVADGAVEQGIERPAGPAAGGVGGVSRPFSRHSCAKTVRHESAKSAKLADLSPRRKSLQIQYLVAASARVRQVRHAARRGCQLDKSARIPNHRMTLGG